MKLYAQVNSDRASKGQGGNKFIRIELTADNAERVNMGMVELEVFEHTGSLDKNSATYDVKYYPPNKEGYMLLHSRLIGGQEKGKKQKTAKSYNCKGCGATMQSYEGKCNSCKGINP